MADGSLEQTMAMYLIWLRVALLLYGVASLAVLPGVLGRGERASRLVLPSTAAAAFFHFVGLAEMLAAAHHPVPASLHEIEALLALLLALAFLAVSSRYRAFSLGLLALPVVFLLLLLPAMGADHAPAAGEWAHSGWITVHIVLLLAAYAALISSLLASLLYLIEERRLKRKQAGGVFRYLPPLETIDRIAFRTLAVGFPCMTAGLLAGAILAEKSVGAAYFLDPKVVLSIGMWLLYVWMLQVRHHTGLRGKRAVYLSSLVFLVALTVWASNLFSAVHRYSAP